VDFEIAETNETWRHATDDRAGLGLRVAVVEHVADHFFSARNQRQRTRGRHPEMMHGLATKKFAQRRAQHGAPIGESRIRGRPCAFQLQLLTLAGGRDQLAQSDRTTIAELSCPIAELMTAVAGRIRAHAGSKRVTREDLHRGPGDGRPREPECRPEIVRPGEQARRGDRSRHHEGVCRIGDGTRAIAVVGISRQCRNHAGFELDVRKITIH
jgi:hypothetical protein